MASPSELTLDCKPHSHSLLLKSFSDQIIITPPPPSNNPPHDDDHDQKQKLEEFVSRLEEERFKIDAFKRELPLCMQLLTNAMETSRQQLQSYMGRNQPAVLEEFIPMKNSTPPPSSTTDQLTSENKGTNNNNNGHVSSSDNKATWMTTAQLWSQDTKPVNHQLPNPIPNKDRTFRQEDGNSLMGFDVLSPARNGSDAKPRNCGAFLPFSKERSSNCTALALAGAATSENEADRDDYVEKKCLENNGFSPDGHLGESGNGGGNGSGSTAAAAGGGGGGGNGGSQRKARRCWSPDLHRRFVNALQMLGGSQVATPKQIRELMKVDGLTNDEVKSHLQKYRLHTRRPSPSPQNPGGPPPQLVVLGGIWVPPEYAATHGGAHAFYGAAHHQPPPPSHYCAAPPPVPQDYYTAAGVPVPALPPPPPPHHHHLHHHHAAAALHHHHQIQLYKASPPSHAHSSGRDSDDRGAGDRSESIEDGKSESGSWKGGESGDNAAGCGGGGGDGGERKDGEECDRREISLKF